MNKLERVVQDYQISYDFDGVCTRVHRPVLKRMNAELGTSYRSSDIRSWHWVRDTVVRLRRDQQLAEKIESLYFQPGVLAEAPPHWEALFVVRFCHHLGFRQSFITSREPDCLEVTIDWLGQYLSWVGTESRLHIRREGSEESGDDFKIRMVGEVGPDIFFEDKGEVVRQLVAVRASDPRLVDRPWNRDFPDLDKRRVRGWFGMMTAIGFNFLRKQILELGDR